MKYILILPKLERAKFENVRPQCNDCLRSVWSFMARGSLVGFYAPLSPLSCYRTFSYSGRAYHSCLHTIIEQDIKAGKINIHQVGCNSGKGKKCVLFSEQCTFGSILVCHLLLL